MNSLSQFFADLKERFDSSFMDADEVRLINLLDGSTVTLGFLKNQNGQPFTLVLSRGKWLRREHFRPVNEGMISFVNDIQRGIILGRRDIIMEQELEDSGWHVRFVDRSQLWRNPQGTRSELLRFLNA